MAEVAREGEFLTVDELFHRWKKQVSKGTLANWRSKGTGPQFIKPGKAVLYPIEEVVKWEHRATSHANDNTT